MNRHPLPIDEPDGFLALRDHLRDRHGARFAWHMDRESFEDLAERMHIAHLEQHVETPEAQDHVHPVEQIGGNGCLVCGGLGRVIAYGIGLDPLTITCPECAGLTLTPASSEDCLEYVPHPADVAV
jgi:hypothetical protein